MTDQLRVLSDITLAPLGQSINFYSLYRSHLRYSQ
jgi:hypothetical protein